MKFGYLVPLSSSQIGTGWSTVQSPPVIETMPCGSTASTPEVVAAAVLTRVMMSARNRRDYDDIPAGARKKLEFVWLERVDDAIAAALEVGATQLGRRVGVATDRPVGGGRAVRAVSEPVRSDRSVTKSGSAIEARGLLLTRVGMRSREFKEFRRSLRHSAGLFMLRLNLSNSAAITTRSAATD